MQRQHIEKIIGNYRKGQQAEQNKTQQVMNKINEEGSAKIEKSIEEDSLTDN